MILAAIAALSMSAQAQFLSWVEVGDYYNATELYNGSYFDMAPTNFYISHTGAQMIYTPDLLTGMEGKDGLKIKYLNFKFYCESYEEIIRNAKVYLREIDETEFATVEFPFTLGKSLLVTIVLDAEDDDNCTMGSDYAPFYTSGIRGKAMTYTDNWTSFVDYANGSEFPNASASVGCGTNVELPVTEVGYTYERMLGDVNGDGFISIGDVTTLIDMMLGSDTGFPVNADINEDGNISIGDVTMLIDSLLIVD